MGWRERIGLKNWLGRASSVPADGGGGASGPPAQASPLSALSWGGGPWPPWGWRYAAENLPVVSACVSAIAGGIASLPAAVYQTMPDRRSPGVAADPSAEPFAKLVRLGRVAVVEYAPARQRHRRGRSRRRGPTLRALPDPVVVLPADPCPRHARRNDRLALCAEFEAGF